MIEEGCRVALVCDIEVYVDGWAAVAAGTRFTVVSTKPGLVTVRSGSDRLTLPARLLRRV